MWREYRKIEEDEFFVVGVDTAAGGLDYCAAQFLSVTKRDVPIVYHAKQLASEMTPELNRKLVDIYTVTGVKPVIAYERNNGGIFELERLSRLNKYNQYTIYQTKQDTGTIRGMQLSPKLGWSTDVSTRPVMLGDLKEAIDNKLFAFYDRPTLNELLSFVVVQTTNSWKAQAENGMHDDLLMALAIAWQLYQTEVQSYTPKIKVVTPKPAKKETKEGYLVINDRLQYNFDMSKALQETTKTQGKDWKYL